MKKIITRIALGLILIGVFGSVLTALPNELAFKIYNQQGVSAFQKKEWEKSRENFQQAVLKFKPWPLVEKNNELAILYEQKKYPELDKRLENIIKKECSLSAKKIPSFCENIFYLSGLTQYRLGENLEIKKQKPFFEKAISEFQKTLALNPQNTWTKENIDFILKNFAKKQQKQNQKSNDKSQKDQQKNQSGGDSKDKKEKQDSSDQKNQQNSTKNKSGESGKKNKDQQKSSQKDAYSEGKKQSSADQNKDGQSGQDKKSTKNSAGENQENSAKKEPAASRLPQNIQQALEQAQKNLEQDKNQKGFNRSQSAAENDKNSRDPFQDDFLQDFFGNDPFFNSFFGGRNEKKFHKNISTPNEKDW